MFKKLFTMFILFAFSTMSTVLAADPQAVNLTKSDVFDNNYQSLNNANSVKQPLSVIEKMYNGKENAVSGTVLKQVGYDLFNSSAAGTGSSTGKYDSNYKLSIGEKINILAYGDSVDVITMSGANLISPMTTTAPITGCNANVLRTNPLLIQDKKLGVSSTILDTLFT